MSRSVKYIEYITPFYDPACIHDIYIITHLCNDPKVMCDKYYRCMHAVPQSQDEVEYLRLYGHIKRCCWFIRN